MKFISAGDVKVKNWLNTATATLPLCDQLKTSLAVQWRIIARRLIISASVISLAGRPERGRHHNGDTPDNIEGLEDATL